MGDLSVLQSVETLNCGKPFTCARDDVLHAADCFRYYAGLADTIGGKTISPGECISWARVSGPTALRWLTQ